MSTVDLTPHSKDVAWALRGYWPEAGGQSDFAAHERARAAATDEVLALLSPVVTAAIASAQEQAWRAGRAHAYLHPECDDPACNPYLPEPDKMKEPGR